MMTTSRAVIGIDLKVEKYDDPEIRSALLDSIKSCVNHNDLLEGSRIHAQIVNKGLFNKDVCIGNALISMYSKCGDLLKAQDVFEDLPKRSVVSWNSLITGYIEHRLADEALRCYASMLHEGFSPSVVTFSSLLKVCGTIGAIDMGVRIHADVSRQGLLGKDTVLDTALVDMYAKSGMLEKAQEVFDKLPTWNTISWNALISGYVEHGFDKEALECFRQMQDEGFCPNAVTLICVLKACGSIGMVEKGEEVHAELNRQGLFGNDVVVSNSLVDMYAKCGALQKAQEVFDTMPLHNVITWNVLIAGYVQHGFSGEAMNCFQRMRDEGFSPNVITFTCLLKALGTIGAGEEGVKMHVEVSKQQLLLKDSVIGNAMVDMYVKCGMLTKAQEVFDELPIHNIVSWTGLIIGYAHFGKAEKVFDCFNEMIGKDLCPNSITYTALLSVCSHLGLLYEGQKHFDSMSTMYSIVPTLEHHSCMIDLFSRAGLFEEAINMIKRVPLASCVLWRNLLGGCVRWIDAKLGKWAFNHVVELDGRNATAYIFMSNICADVCMEVCANQVEALGKRKETWQLH